MRSKMVHSPSSAVQMHPSIHLDVLGDRLRLRILLQPPAHKNDIPEQFWEDMQSIVEAIEQFLRD